MPINVSEAIDSDTAVMLAVERATPGTYVDGIWQSGGVNTMLAMISPQQPTPKQVNMLPEGMRGEDIMVFISNKRLYTDDDRDGLSADKVVFEGYRYKIIKSGNWQTFGQTTAIGVRIQ